MDKISYKLDVFEGPLDLLLHLIEKNKLNIYDIQISELCEQYMEHIRTMQEENLDIAGEFLDMASRLIQIKSAMLLPKYDEGEEMKKELEYIKKTTEKQMYINDLTNLRKELEKDFK